MTTYHTDLQACRRLMRGGSKSFFAASLVLPPRVRAPATALYAFCRVADDAIDLSEQPAQALDGLRQRLDAVYAGTPQAIVADRALARVVERFAIPRSLPDALLEGFAWDAEGRRYESLEAVHDYAARVAGAVGAMMALVMETREPRALARACELGVAMQLTNIARDVGEDARKGRLQQRQQRRIAHLHAAAARHVGRVRHQCRHRAPAVVGVVRHRQHRVDGTRLEQALGQAGRDAAPLRTGAGCGEARAQHAAQRAEVQLAGPARVARPPVHTRFEARVVGGDELAGTAAAVRVAAARDAAIGAQRSVRRGGGDQGRQGVTSHRACLHARPCRAPPSRGPCGSSAAATSRRRARRRRPSQPRRRSAAGAIPCGASPTASHRLRLRAAALALAEALEQVEHAQRALVEGAARQDAGG